MLFLIFVWLVVGSSIFLWFIAMLFSICSRRFLHTGKGELSPRFMFQITSRDCLDTVVRGINSIVRSCYESGFSNYELWVVTDNPSPPRLADGRTKVVIVPDEFECEAQYKARALEYARKKRIYEAYDGWIYFMDEENWVTRQTIDAITSFAKHGKAKLASGPLTFNSGGSKLVWLGDAIRGAECRVCHLGHSCGWWPVHGENLVTHSEVEKQVGWEFDCLTEDVCFAASAGAKGYRTGWHGGLLYSTSPTTFLDFLRQRRRWFRGMLQVILNKGLKVKYRALELYLLLCGLMGILFIVGTAVAFFKGLVPNFFIYYYLCPTIILLSTAYLVGCNGRPRDRLLALLFGWVFAILEGIAAWWSLVRPPKSFDIVRKT